MPLASNRNERLVASPLTLVVAQLRFEQRSEIRERTFLREFDVSLEGAYPHVEVAQTANVLISNDGQVSQTTDQGWKLQSKDRAWSVVAVEGAVALETTTYGRWTEFRERLEVVLQALEKIVAPATEQRLGLRYVDNLPPDAARTGAQWRGRVRDEFLGSLLHPTIGDRIILSEQRVVIDLGNGHLCAIRHGFAPNIDGDVGYVLDFDAYREAHKIYDASSIRDAFEDFHSKSKGLFELCLTDEYYGSLRDGKEGRK